MEHTLSKRRIVEIYLNVAEWGEGIFGIEAAAKHYYGKHASSLTAQEAARLATVLPNPRIYQVNGDSRYVQNRSERIYQIMVARGIVIPEYDEVMTTPEETAPVVTAGTLTSETTTAGIKPPAGEATQDKTPEASTQKIENPNPPNTTIPETGSDKNSVPEPVSGAENGGTQ
jgi:monofunctional biosynthetic peptidoglycan transglycosylase